MVATPPPVSLYATRWKPFVAALCCAGLIAIALLFYFVWPTPPTAVHPWEYQEPAKTILFLVVLLGCATFEVCALYWTLTPHPLLQVSASGLVCRRFPFPTRTIHWQDVEYVSAGIIRRAVTPLTQMTILALWFTLKPGQVAAESDQGLLHLDINPGTLSLRADELVQVIRTYHDVHTQ